MSVESGHGSNWRAWLAHLIGTPTHGLEVGAFKGESAEWMLQNVFTHADATYTSVDHFQGGADHHVYGIDCSGLRAECEARLAPYPQSRIVVGESHKVLRRWDHPLDFVYVDGSHDAMNTLRDAVLAFDLLKPGGVLVFDDYGWKEMPDPLDRPRMAIDAFLECYERQALLLAMGWQVAVQKQ